MKILKGHNSDWHLKTYEQYDENFKGTQLRLTFENLEYYDENFKGTWLRLTFENLRVLWWKF
jgi:hypothetical protein